ncbi:MAG: malto-oligosyltrehalose synthase [Thermoguttaceae bacterium]|jgi:(1->4)-alpha-D-glucan 1-alpha-D-glucosylmutase|nr:malto-oligosyltrehalose synthase [Thermoguttaceae bacterium]
MDDLSTLQTETVAAVRDILSQRTQRPRATYRLQFHRDHLTFRDAAALVPYLSQLGVSHVYASPYLKARSGSEHGYAIVDYTRLDPGLGTEEDFEAFVVTLREYGMGQILDVVPNHMSAAPGENPWWTDVLENGPGSPYADFFDIDWIPVKEELRGKILLPVLGRQFGEVLEAGELKLCRRGGAFVIDYYGRTLPVDPSTYGAILTLGLDELRKAMPEDSDDLRELESIVTAIEHLPSRNDRDHEAVRERQREKEIIKGRIADIIEASSPIAEFIEGNVQQLNGTPDDFKSFDRLEHLLNAQAYRLSHWKAASDEINYRRFFDVNELAAVCMEDEEVFNASHAFVFELLAKGKVQGLRIDHVDGLFDPLEYLWRLQRGYVRALARHCFETRRPASGDGGTAGGAHAAPTWKEVEPAVMEALWPELKREAGAERSSGSQPWRESPPLYVVVEKILGPEAPLPPEWPIAGTTGYDFLNSVGGVFVDPAGLDPLLKMYRRFTGEPTNFHEVAYQCKLLILRVAMSSELHLLAQRLNRLSERHRLHRDFTLNSLLRVLREILAAFPVYRTYIGADSVSMRDRGVVARAVARAKRRNPAMDAAEFDFVRDVLLLEQPPRLDNATRRQREFFVGRFQQVTSPVMAKGVEDTAFYRYYPLASANEVGGEPARAAVAVDDFHEDNRQRHTRHPGSMVCTSTHDTKRSEDVRARIDVLSEIPYRWRANVTRWARINRRFRREVDGQPAPSRNDEYLLYQTLAGIWPLETPDAAAHQGVIDRLVRYMDKATHEAKLRTSWISPDADYDEAVAQFVHDVLRNEPKNRFLPALRDFHDETIGRGLYTALSQMLLKLTAPGVPDIYQGQELWAFHLVDPDNRGPVDFDRRRWLLGEIEGRAANQESLAELAQELGAAPRDARLKLFVTWRTLQFRQAHAALFAAGDYIPLQVEGAKAGHVCAFTRRLPDSADVKDQTAVVIVPRLLAQLTPRQDDGNVPPPFGSVWEDTRVVLPEAVRASLQNVFTGETLPGDATELPLSRILAIFPVALLGGTM